MSYLSTALQRQAERHRLSQSELARGSGLSKSYISRLFSGEAHELSDPNFISILKTFAADPLAQAELVGARCLDAKEGARASGLPGVDLVEIRIKTKAEPPSATPGPEVQLAQETERAFAWLRSQCPVNPDLEKHLVGYARLTGMK